MTRAGDIVRSAEPGGPHEDRGCVGLSGHSLRRRTVSALEELVTCWKCGAAWIQRTGRVDSIRKEIVRELTPEFVIKHPPHVSALDKLERIAAIRNEVGDKVPQSFRDFARMRGEQQKREMAAELRRRREGR